MEQMVERKLSWIQKLRKKVYMRFMKADSIKGFHNLPPFLKYDREVIELLFSKCRDTNKPIIIEEKGLGLHSSLMQPKLPFTPEMINLIREVPYSITLLNIEELNELMKSNKEFKKFTSLLPSDKQIEVLNGFAGRDMSNFPDDVIINYCIEVKKNGEKIPSSSLNLQEFSEDIQLKIGLIDNSYLQDMTPKMQSKFVHGNRLVAKMLKLHMFEDDYVEYGKHVNCVIRTDDIDLLKSIFTHEPMGNYSEYVQIMKPQTLLELMKYSNLNPHLEIENAVLNPIIVEIKKELIQSENNAELIDLLDGLYDSFEEVSESEDVLNRFIKVALNKDIAEKIDGAEIADYLKNPERTKLLDIVGKTFGDRARKILEERPKLDIDDIPNLYIFNHTIMEEFSLGDIHNFLSYNNLGVNVITDLARYPEKMAQYRKFSSLTQDYFESTPQDMDKKLSAFADFYELMSSIDSISEFSDNQIKSMQDILRDYCNGTLPFKVRTWDEVENYGQIKDRLYHEAMEKMSDSKNIRKLIFGRFFNPDGQRNHRLVSDYDNLVNNVLTQDEADYIELLEIISNIKDEKVLKSIYDELLKDETMVNPQRFNEINRKIEEHYYEALTTSLLSPENIIQRYENGEEGISVREKDGVKIITLEGADFFAYVSNLNSNMSRRVRMVDIMDTYERWTNLEAGVSTISGCLIGCLDGKENVTGLALPNHMRCGFSDFPPTQILAMGTDDVHTDHNPKKLEPSVAPRQGRVIIDYPEKVLSFDNTKSVESLSSPEMAIFRREQDSRNIKENTFGGRIMPTYIMGAKDTSVDQMIAEAKKFNVGYVVIVDIEKYRNIETRDNKQERNEPYPKREDSSLIRKYKEIIEDER